MHRMKVVGPLAAQTILGLLLGTECSAAARGFDEFSRNPRAASTPYAFVALNLGLVATALSGDLAGVQQLLPLQLRALQEIPCNVNEWGAGRDCGATVVWQLELTAFARPYLELAERHADVAGAACWSSVAHSRARMLSLLGEWDEARAVFAIARGDFSSSGRRPALALCDYDEALTAERAGQVQDARRLAHAASTLFETLTTTPWLSKAQNLIARLDSVPTLNTETSSVLSVREREVLNLLAQGLANKEIGERLFISVPTVERHIANVYDKIGCRGRAAATAYALKNGLVSST